MRLTATLAAILAAASLAAPAQAQAVKGAAEYILDYDAIHHPVMGRKGMVVSQSEIASQVGADILRQGGNAVDAAVATGLALAVTLPRAGNLGGGGFMLVHLAKEKKTLAIDYYGQAPAATDAALLAGPNGKMDPAKRYSHRAVAVPGTVKGLYEVHRQYGKLPWKKLVEPAVKLASDGLILTDDMTYALDVYREGLLADAPSAKALYKAGGATYVPGERLKQPDLAWSLRQIRDGGADAFYRGELGRRVVAGVQAGGGVLTQADLAGYEIKIQEPLWCDYRGTPVAYMPPPAAGVLLCELMNIVERFPMAEYGQNSVQSLHVNAEAMKLVFADRAKFMGGWPQYQPPVGGLSSKAYAAERAKLIDLGKAMDQKVSPGDPLLFESRDTTHYSVADAEGNVVSNTFTLGSSFGAHVMAAGTGFFLNDAMANFAWGGDERANAPEPGKRVISTITPLIAFKDDKPWLVAGTPGGTRIIPAMAQLLSNVVDHKLNVAEATQRPRIFQAASDTPIEFEPGFPIDMLKLMEAKGHKTRTSLTMGSTQSIMIEDGVFEGGADSRRPDAAAVPVD
ncbi:gamma-glutamyltransferase [Phenylobacterium sp. LjRoot164]|uniref:gamma-glutamyltransferase n=1 Tax=unclassified Phenylobacterium TaxID=2640670 RepID=UPI003ECDAE52